MSVKDKFNIFEKMYDILMILVDFCGNFQWFRRFFATRIRIRFIKTDPDPADQNETDPNGSGSLNICDILITYLGL